MLFGFSYSTKRYRWGHLPQGWKWSSVLFHERIAEILDGLPCPQYSDNVFDAKPWTLGGDYLWDLDRACIYVSVCINAPGRGQFIVLYICLSYLE